MKKDIKTKEKVMEKKIDINEKDLIALKIGEKVMMYKFRDIRSDLNHNVWYTFIYTSPAFSDNTPVFVNVFEVNMSGGDITPMFGDAGLYRSDNVATNAGGCVFRFMYDWNNNLPIGFDFLIINP